ncbi:hypothetical protein WOLCODRAFT_158832 [Wolfiporia cocos MD-104 SS10]|uniref:Fungal-type protein kinase domain-containing protein n=1 Tax=Wolfiporia cocos (strain MD-104) TaxID=742152 RepID=A0A2H3JT76_WOLCO|nr:hypothetical protein WOLCODRAFT_158832 [Wolfiporia cocos MD-104 SS10]
MELIDEDQEVVCHEAHHGLESFSWLLIWFALRHTKREHPEDDGAFKEIFGGITPRQVRYRKQRFFFEDMFTVKNNDPLSCLLKRLRSMIFDTNVWGGYLANITQTPVSLTYDAMLEAFEEALGMEGWPKDDAAIPIKPPPLSSETDRRMDTKTSCGVIGTYRPLKLDRAGPALPNCDGNTQSSPSEPQDAEGVIVLAVTLRCPELTGRSREPLCDETLITGRSMLLIL